MTFRTLKSFLAAERGAAAVETALIMPFLLILYFGMIDLTQLITMNRKVTYAASVMADVVSQSKTVINPGQITDYYNSVDLIMKPQPGTDLRINLFGYRDVSGTVTQVWSHSNDVGPTCTASPNPADMPTLMTAGNDLVVAVACYDYVPYVAQFAGEYLLGDSSFRLEQVVMLRPRSSLQLTCYDSGTSGSVCP